MILCLKAKSQKASLCKKYNVLNHEVRGLWQLPWGWQSGSLTKLHLTGILGSLNTSSLPVPQHSCFRCSGTANYFLPSFSSSPSLPSFPPSFSLFSLSSPFLLPTSSFFLFSSSYVSFIHFPSPLNFLHQFLFPHPPLFLHPPLFIHLLSQ